MTISYKECVMFSQWFSGFKLSSYTSNSSKINSVLPTYLKTNLVFLSHLFGRHSTVANVLSQSSEMLLNIVLAAVCIGYIAGLMTFIFSSMTMGSASMVALFLLGCALPFELLNTVVQNSGSLTNNKPLLIKNHPISSQVIAVISSFLGAVQYLIRNYNLVKNFGGTITGAKFIRQIRQLLGIYLNSARFAILGGLVGFMAHILLSYGNWDKLVEIGEKDSQLSIIANTLWLAAGVVLFSKLAIGQAFLKSLASVGVIGYLAFQCLPALPTNRLKSIWQETAVVTLPLGALLYTLVDFFNSYQIMESMGWLSPATTGLCVAFGLLSWLNVTLVWGYNMVRSIYLEHNSPVDNKHPAFVRYYYSDAAVRRVISYAKEIILCGLDMLNNQLTLGMINYVLMAVANVSINLMALNFCTVCYAMNRLVVLYFQSSEDKQDYVKSGEYKRTLAAETCRNISERVSNFTGSLGVGHSH